MYLFAAALADAASIAINACCALSTNRSLGGFIGLLMRAKVDSGRNAAASATASDPAFFMVIAQIRTLLIITTIVWKEPER